MSPPQTNEVGRSAMLMPGFLWLARRFGPKLVQGFHDSAGVTAIRSGLQEGEKVVASGLFLIDSEANIAGALERMRAQAPDAAASAAHAH